VEEVGFQACGALSMGERIVGNKFLVCWSNGFLNS
jgi:hypothetical protein